MIDIVLVTLFCYQLNRLAKLRGLPSLPYVLNYLAAFFLMMLLFVYLFTSFYGADVFKNEEGIKAALMFEPFAIMFEVFLFLFFRKRIQKAQPFQDDSNDYTPPSPPKEKKDLSYFR